uniref:Uncharacterized protein n=1 Tax=Timema genevievae TaxID=629358 RepID=A0A7R9K9D1_TIMGE|nr:unnamed protein product [Timema genevievae]
MQIRVRIPFGCIDAVCRSIDRQTSALKYLPASLKSILLHVLSRRSALNVTVVTSLLNHSVEKLDLTSCKGLDDQALRSLVSCSQLRELAINKQIRCETKEFDSSSELH